MTQHYRRCRGITARRCATRGLPWVAATWLIAGAAGAAQAQTAPAPTPDSTPAPDKWQYTLFNPTPNDAMRAFSTDRPNKSNSPYTVDAGHFQIETDFANTSYFHSGGVSTRTWEFADPVLKVGLTNNTDFELGISGYEQANVSGGGVPGTRVSGFGDLYPRLKVNLLGNDSGDVSVAVIPYIKIPTANRNVGNGKVEGGVILTVGFNLPWDFSAVAMTELDALKNGANGGKHANFVNLVNVSHTIVGDLTGSVELATQVADDRNSTNSYTADFALSYLLLPNLQLDVATYVGLNRDAPKFTLYSGISWRY